MRVFVCVCVAQSGGLVLFHGSGERAVRGKAAILSHAERSRNPEPEENRVTTKRKRKQVQLQRETERDRE